MTCQKDSNLANSLRLKLGKGRIAEQHAEYGLLVGRLFPTSQTEFVLASHTALRPAQQRVILG